jgi:hypothetical protein
MILYRCIVGEQEIGPLTQEMVVKAYLDDTLSRDTLAWHEGLPEWQPLYQLIMLPERPPRPVVPDADTKAEELPVVPPRRGEIVCLDCGNRGWKKVLKRGSGVLEGCLWIVGLLLILACGIGIIFCVIPLVYSIWRASTRCWACRWCGSSRIVPAGSPRGQELLTAA